MRTRKLLKLFMHLNVTIFGRGLAFVDLLFRSQFSLKFSSILIGFYPQLFCDRKIPSRRRERHGGGMVVFRKMVPILETRIYQSWKMSRIKLKGKSISTFLCLEKSPQEVGREGRKGGWSFFKKWCRFLKREFIKLEDVKDKS